MADLLSYARKKHKHKHLFGKRTKIDTKKETRIVEGESKVWETPVLSSIQYQSYDRIYNRVSDIAHGLMHHGLKNGDFIGIYEDTRMEWSMTAQ